jgi:hypothetical protein
MLNDELQLAIQVINQGFAMLTECLEVPER